MFSYKTMVLTVELMCPSNLPSLFFSVEVTVDGDNCDAPQFAVILPLSVNHRFVFL